MGNGKYIEKLEAEIRNHKELLTILVSSSTGVFSDNVVENHRRQLAMKHDMVTLLRKMN